MSRWRLRRETTADAATAGQRPHRWRKRPKRRAPMKRAAKKWRWRQSRPAAARRPTRGMLAAPVPAARQGCDTPEYTPPPPLSTHRRRSGLHDDASTRIAASVHVTSCDRCHRPARPSRIATGVASAPRMRIMYGTATPWRVAAARAIDVTRPLRARKSSEFLFYAAEREPAGCETNRRACMIMHRRAGRCPVSPRRSSRVHGGFTHVAAYLGMPPLFRAASKASNAAHPRRRHFEIASSAMPFVRGPIRPIAAITIAIAPAMNTNTPAVPKPFSTAAITNDVKIAEKRLHE